jgi:hypothetical protein
MVPMEGGVGEAREGVDEERDQTRGWLIGWRLTLVSSRLLLLLLLKVEVEGAESRKEEGGKV